MNSSRQEVSDDPNMKTWRKRQLLMSKNIKRALMSF